MEKEELDSLVLKILEKDKNIFNWDEIAETIGAETVANQEKSEALMAELERRGITIREEIPDLPEEEDEDNLVVDNDDEGNIPEDAEAKIAEQAEKEAAIPQIGRAHV